MADLRVRDLVDALDAAYPPRLAAEWDAVGLTCGDPDDTVERVLQLLGAQNAQPKAWGGLG